MSVKKNDEASDTPRPGRQTKRKAAALAEASSLAG